MSIRTHSFTSLGARDFQPRIGFGSSFARPWFEASRPVADGRLGDESEQGGRVGGVEFVEQVALRECLQLVRRHSPFLPAEFCEHVVDVSFDFRLFVKTSG
jgi:hypothetical protein